MKTAVSNNKITINFSKESNVNGVYSDGCFEFSHPDNTLSLSKSLGELIDIQSKELHSALNEISFEPQDRKDGVSKIEISYMNKLNQEIVLSFRYTKVSNPDAIKGEVFLVQTQSVLDPISTVYHNLSLKALSSSFAHDINNPLSILSSVSDWMSIRLSKDDVNVSSFKDKLEILKTSIKRIQILISGIENTVKGFDFNQNNFFLDKAVQKTRKIFAKRIKNHQIAIDTNIESGIDVVGDPVLISQVLFNVFSSVVAFATNQKVKQITIKSESENSIVYLSFVVLGSYARDEDRFLQNVNSEVINRMLSYHNASFENKILKDCVEFKIQLKKKD